MTAPYSNLPFPQPGQSLQRERRTYREFTDQHGRAFAAQAEMATNQPIGELMPVGFNPPWQPPMRFAKWRTDGDLKFRWDYETMANELSGDTAQYYEDATKLAVENKIAVPEIGGPVDRIIRYVLGPPPMSPAIPLAADAGDPWILGVKDASVNLFLKGLLAQHAGASAREAFNAIRAQVRAQADASAVPLVPSEPVVPEKHQSPRTIDTVDAANLPNVTYKEFLAACLTRGMAMPDAALAWQEHKRLLKEVAA